MTLSRWWAMALLLAVGVALCFLAAWVAPFAALPADVGPETNLLAAQAAQIDHLWTWVESRLVAVALFVGLVTFAGFHLQLWHRAATGAASVLRVGLAVALAFGLGWLLFVGDAHQEILRAASAGESSLLVRALSRPQFGQSASFSGALLAPLFDPSRWTVTSWRWGSLLDLVLFTVAAVALALLLYRFARAREARYQAQ
jgi:hypothetical protein